MLVVALRLPFNLAVEDGAVFVMRRSYDRDEPPWVSLKIRRVSISLRDSALSPYDSGLSVLRGGAGPASGEGTSVHTWVLAETFNVPFDDEGVSLDQLEPEQFLTIVFERALTAVNRLLAAEKLLTAHPWSRPVAKEALDADVQLFEVRDDRLTPLVRMDLHHRPHNPEVISKDPDLRVKVSEAIGQRLRSDAAVRPHPLVLSRELEQRAHTYRLYGDYPGAIITLQTSAETYLRGVHRLALIDAGATGAQVDEAGEVPFETVVTSELPRLLGGAWSGARSPITAYRSDLAQVRHRITHAGIAPGWHQVDPAFTAHRDVVAFVEKRVRERFRVLPRTLTAAWEPWAGGTLTLSKAAEHVVRQLLDEPQPYWLPVDEAGRAVPASQIGP